MQFLHKYSEKDIKLQIKLISLSLQRFILQYFFKVFFHTTQHFSQFRNRISPLTNNIIPWL